MANITIDGITYATDTIGGVNYELFKIVGGEAGNAEPIGGTALYGLKGDITRIQTPVAVTGPLTNAEARASALPVVGPMTNTEARASALPVSGNWTVGGLTDAQLRAN